MYNKQLCLNVFVNKTQTELRKKVQRFIKTKTFAFNIQPNHKKMEQSNVKVLNALVKYRYKYCSQFSGLSLRDFYYLHCKFHNIQIQTKRDLGRLNTFVFTF